MIKLSSAFVISLVITLSQASVSRHDPFYCFATDPIKPQSSMFSTKVAYEVARGDFFANPSRSSKAFLMKVFFCNFQQNIFSVYPSKVLHVQQTRIKIAIVK